MEYIKIKCKKCSYEIDIPEKTESVVCGYCGNVNYFSKISSILKKYNDSILADKYNEVSGEIVQPEVESGKILVHIPGDTGSLQDEDVSELPENKSLFKITTIMFILAPFIAMAIEFFKLPSYAVLLIIIGIVGVIYFLKK